MRLRAIAGAAVLAVVIWRLGTGPFVDGLRTITGWSLLATAGIAIATTACSAWRWQLIARRLGAYIPLRSAIAACYRSQFLNTALPGGVLGDVHRAVRQGRAAGDVGLGLRAVVWERTAGQVVQIAIALVVLVVMPSPVRTAMPLVLAASAAVVAIAALLVRHLGGRASRWGRVTRAAATDIRGALLARSAWPGISAASTVTVAGHAATLLLAARVAGSTASTTRLLPLVVLILLAMAIPANFGGWGPREGVAAWSFAAAGFDARVGVAVATVYGVLVTVAVLPGAGVLAWEWLRRRQQASVHARVSEWAAAAVQPAVRPEGSAGG